MIRIEIHHAETNGHSGPGWYWQAMDADTGTSITFPLGPHATREGAEKAAAFYLANRGEAAQS